MYFPIFSRYLGIGRRLVNRGAHTLLKQTRHLSINHCGYTVFLDAKDFCGRDIFLRNFIRGHWHHEEFEKSLVRNIFYRFNRVCFVDVGASYGMYTILAASDSFQDHVKNIYAVEGSPDTFRWLAKTIHYNNLDSRILAYNLAIADTDGAMLPFFRHPQFSEWSRLSYSPNDEKHHGGIVLTTSLDKLLVEYRASDYDLLFLKIDIEGGEPRALRGLNSVFKDIEEYAVIVEFHVPLLERIGGGALAFAQQILAYNPEYVFEISEAQGRLIPIKNDGDFRNLIDRCAKGKELWQIMTNIIFGSKALGFLVTS